MDLQIFSFLNDMTKKQKICFYCPNAYPLFNHSCKTPVGGAETQIYFISTAIAQDSNFEVNFIVGDFNQPIYEIRHNIHIFKLKNMNAPNTLLVKPMIVHLVLGFRLIKKINADIYITRAAGFMAGVIRLFTFFLGKKFIFMTASDSDCNLSYGKNKIWLFAKLYHFGLKRADLVISQTNHQAQLLQQNFQKNARVIKSICHIIPPPQKTEDKFILWVGRCRDCKRPDLFIKITDFFPQEKFVMITNPGTDYIYNQTIKSIGQNKTNLRYLNGLHFTQVNDYYTQAKVLVNTSDFEGFPNTFLEAAKNKKPILSLNTNPDGFLITYNCGFYAQNDFNLLVNQLKTLINNKKLRQQMGANSYNYIKNHHNIHRNVKKHKILYQQLI